MYKKWLKLEIFYKNLTISVFYSIILISIALILLILNTSYIYGTLIGLGSLWIVNGIIWLLWFKFKKVKGFMAAITPIALLFIRLAIFTGQFLLIILVINHAHNKADNLNIMFSPVNAFADLLAYSIPLISYLTVGNIHLFGSIKENKGKGK